MFIYYICHPETGCISVTLEGSWALSWFLNILRLKPLNDSWPSLRLAGHPETAVLTLLSKDLT